MKKSTLEEFRDYIIKEDKYHSGICEHWDYFIDCAEETCDDCIGCLHDVMLKLYSKIKPDRSSGRAVIKRHLS